MTVAAGTFERHRQPRALPCAETVSGVVVVEDGTTVQDFALSRAAGCTAPSPTWTTASRLEGALVEAEDGSMTYTGPDGSYELWLDPGRTT